MNTTRKRKTATPAAPATAATPDAPAKRTRAKAADAANAVRPSRKVAPASAPKRAAAPRRAAAPKRAAAAVAQVVESAPKPRRAKARPAAEPTLDVRVRDAVVARLDAMKANDLRVIDVRGKTSVTDCLVIASGTSTRHVKSMGDEVVVTAKQLGMPPIGIEGEKDAEWILVDLGDTVVHVMLPRTREFYGLERLWTLAEESRAANATA